ncbi:MAG: hypothetical protein HYS24_05000 [Ignavibacteriales bacterium]|nr:hypothetical protein [Ignavibacteriales bacterium]MBK7980501.1 hypothetical protein [Ignavibacteriota bacterium]
MIYEAEKFDWTIDNRGSNKLNHNLYKTPQGNIYYHRLKFNNTDEEIISQVNPDVIWALEFDESVIKKYYLQSRNWLTKEYQKAS